MASNKWAPYTANQGNTQQDEWNNQDWSNTWNDDYQSDTNTEWWVNNDPQQQASNNFADNSGGQQSVQYGGVTQEYFQNSHHGDQLQSAVVDEYGYSVYSSQQEASAVVYSYDNQSHHYMSEPQQVTGNDGWQHSFGQAEQPADQWSTIDTSDQVPADIDSAAVSHEDAANIHVGNQVSDLPLEVRPVGSATDVITDTSVKQPTLDDSDYNIDNSFERSNHLEVPGAQNRSVDNSRVRFIIGSEPVSATHSQADTPEPSERLATETVSNSSILSASYVDGPMNTEPDGAETELPGSPHSQQYASTPASSNSVASQIMFAEHASGGNASHGIPQLAADFADVSLVDNADEDRRDEDDSFVHHTQNDPATSGHYQQDFTLSHPVYTNTMYDDAANRHGGNRPPPVTTITGRTPQALAGQYRQPAEGQLMISADIPPASGNRTAASSQDTAHVGSQNSAFSPVSGPRGSGHQPSSPGQQHRAVEVRSNPLSGATDAGIAVSTANQYNDRVTNFERQRSVPVGHDDHEDSRAAVLSPQSSADSHRSSLSDSSQVGTAGANSSGGASLLARPQLLEGKSSQSLAQQPPPPLSTVAGARSNNAVAEATNRVPAGPPTGKVTSSGGDANVSFRRDVDVPVSSTTTQRQQLGGNEQDGRSHAQPATNLSSSSGGSVDYTSRGGGYPQLDNSRGSSNTSLVSSGSRSGKEGQGQGHEMITPAANYNRAGDNKLQQQQPQTKSEALRYDRNGGGANNLQYPPSGPSQGQGYESRSGDQSSAYQRHPQQQQQRGSLSQEEYGMRLEQQQYEQQQYEYRPSSRASVDDYGHSSQPYPSQNEDARGRQMYGQDGRQGYGPPRQQQRSGDRPTSRQGYPEPNQQPYESNSYNAYDRPGSRSGYDNQRSGDFTSYDRPLSRSSAYDERESRSGYRERQAYRDRSVSREEEEYYRHRQQQAADPRHGGYPPPMDRQSSRGSQRERDRERSSRYDYTMRDSSVERSAYPSDSRGNYDRPSSRSEQRADYNGLDRSRNSRDFESTRRQRTGYYGQDQQYAGYAANPSAYSDSYASYYDPQYQRSQLDQHMIGYLAEARKYGPEYVKQVMDWYQECNDYIERTSRNATPAALDYSESTADHFAQDNGHGSRPSSRLGSRPSSRQSNRDYERYPAMGSEMDAYDYGTQAETPGRHTPHKHSMPHVRASFGPTGQIVKVMPSRPADGEPAIVIMEQLPPPLLLDRDEVAAFPGPLARGVTHKNDVLLFCQRRLQELRNANTHYADREGLELIWKYLELLIKQNGVMLGTDIADLLLDKLPAAAGNVTIGGGNMADTSRLDASMLPFGETSIVQADADVMERFRHLLLHGRRKDALEWAMKHNQWGCAFFLASKMDAKTHASVLTRFANSTMRMNDPLQTFYQLMSGRQPAAVTLAGDDKWGDWRPHLAMILSNASPKPDVDKKSIIALGDTLGGKLYTYSSHFCYLMGGMTLGSHLKKADKLVLIGAHHGARVEELIAPYLIQCTEVYEYARALANQEFHIPAFQLYKFLYAIKLLDAGFVDEALQYCEVVATAVAQNPYGYAEGLIQALLILGGRLQGARLDEETTADQLQLPAWVTTLESVAASYASQVQQSQGYVYSDQQYQYSQAESTMYAGQGQDMSHVGYSSEYYPTPVEDSQSHYAAMTTSVTTSSTVYGEGQVYQQSDPYLPYGQPEQHPQILNIQHQQESYAQFGMPDTGAMDTSHPAYAAYPGDNGVKVSGDASDGQDTGVKVAESVPAGDESSKVTDAPPPPSQARSTAPPPMKAMTAKVMQPFQPTPVDNTTQDYASDSVDGSQLAPGFDYYAAATGQAADPNVGLGTRGRQKWPGEDDDDNGGGGKSSSADKKKKSASDAAKNGEPAQPGLLGSLWNKMRGPKTHAMKLPDDNKPSIVWDAAKGRYMNSDGTEIAPKESVAPPPIMANQPRAAGAAPPARANLAKLDPKKRYVDVMASSNTLKPSPSAPASLFSVTPASGGNVKPASFLMPREDRRISESQEDVDTDVTGAAPPATVSHPQVGSVAADTGSRRGSNASTADPHQIAGKPAPVGFSQPAAQGQGYAPAAPGAGAQVARRPGAPPPAMGQAASKAPPPLKPALGPQAVPARPAAAGYMQPGLPVDSSSYNSNNSASAQPLDMDSVDSQPAAPAADMPVFFNPSQMMAGGGAASHRSGGYHPGQRRAYPR